MRNIICVLVWTTTHFSLYRDQVPPSSSLQGDGGEYSASSSLATTTTDDSTSNLYDITAQADPSVPVDTQASSPSNPTVPIPEVAIEDTPMKNPIPAANAATKPTIEVWRNTLEATLRGGGCLPYVAH